jgi:hypothetical protein
VEIFLNWINDGGLAGWIEHTLGSSDEAKLKDIAQVYDQIRSIFGV